MNNIHSEQYFTRCLTGLHDSTPPERIPGAHAQLDALFVTLLRIVIDQRDDGALFDIWYRLLDVPTWPEILRRYVLHKAAAEGGVPDRVKLVGSLLAGGPVADLHCDQHLTLLHFLCDEVIDTPLVHDLLDGMCILGWVFAIPQGLCLFALSFED